MKNIDVYARSRRHNGLILHRQPLPFVPRLVLAFQKAAASTANSGGRGGASGNRERGWRERGSKRKRAKERQTYRQTEKVGGGEREKRAECAPRGSATLGGSFVVCGPGAKGGTGEDQNRGVAWWIGEHGGYRERESGGGASAAEGKGNRERLGFGVEFDPPVEVLFRHCDNSNNAGLTGTVHEGMKARGGMPEGSGASLRRRSTPPISFATSKQASRASSLYVPVGTLVCALCAGLFAVPIPSASFHLSLFHTNTATLHRAWTRLHRKRVYHTFSSAPRDSCLCTFANAKSLIIKQDFINSKDRVPYISQ